MGWHLWGCIIAKRGRKTVFNLWAIQCMVDLREAGCSLRTASQRAREALLAKRIKAPSWETLRSHFRELEQSGELPPPSGSPAARTNSLLAAFDRRYDRIGEARQERIEAEETATALGLDLSGDLEALEALANDLRRRHTHLYEFIHNDPDSQTRIFISRGVRDKQEAARMLAADMEEMDLLDRQMEALRTVRHLRQMLAAAD